MNIIRDDVIGILKYNDGNKFKDTRITLFGNIMGITKEKRESIRKMV